QLVTLTLVLWPGHGTPAELAPAPGPGLAVAPPIVSVDQPLPIPESGGAWALRQRLLEGDDKLPIPEAFDFVDSPEENLSAFGSQMFQHSEGHKR
ncbi:MAG TPA: hypothetical protein VHR72_07570, partial [Gemmataceae bacterium]|nr:hypothetical protein [Gemmataceae bacterium]